MLKGVSETAYRGQARREAGRVQVHDMRAGLLLEELPDDPHIHLPQVEAGGDGSYPIFLVTTWAELVRHAAELV